MEKEMMSEVLVVWLPILVIMSLIYYFGLRYKKEEMPNSYIKRKKEVVTLDLTRNSRVICFALWLKRKGYDIKFGSEACVDDRSISSDKESFIKYNLLLTRFMREYK